jgi:hypothetical protein
MLSAIYTQECDTEWNHMRLFFGNEEYWQAFEGVNQQPSIRADSGQEFMIPVVVHVIHLGEPIGIGSNISDDRIEGAINKLNNNFLIPAGNDIGIRFCLATIDPGGNPTNGIVRVDGRTVPNYESQGLESSQGTGADETAVKDLSRWPNTQYYNIWVVHTIVGGVAGYAYYPTTYINDGTSIEAAFMSNQFSTLTHELGHAFNLRHTFQGDNDGNSCPPNQDCTSQGDFICDTPPHKRGECFFGSSCASGGAPFNNSANNFMSYCGITQKFTPEQRTRMRNAAMAYPRSELARSMGCQPPPDVDGSLTAITHPLAGQLNEYCNDEIIGSFILTNTGANTINTLGISYAYDGDLQTAGYSTFLPSGASEEFFLPPASLNTSIDFHMLQVIIQSVNEGDDENPLNDTATIVFDITDSCVSTGIYDNFFGEVVIYPNPVMGEHFYIKGLTGIHGQIDLTISDALGRSILEKRIDYANAYIDLSGVARGAYFVTLFSEQRQRTFQVIKQ